MDTDLLRFVLPAGLVDWFEVEGVEPTERTIRIVLREKNMVPPFPEGQQGKNVVSKGFKEILIDDFPIRGKKTELLLFRRVWQIEGTDILFKRDIGIMASGTKLEKEFALFLKELDRAAAGLH